MASGGYRPGAGRPKGSVQGRHGKGETIPRLRLKPLEYMLKVMNNPKADPARRDRMAIAAAPFVHARGIDEDKGKKEQRQEEAKTAQAGTDWEADLKQPPAQTLQ